MIKELPILFSAPMVVANHNGSKSCTRRTTGLDLINERPDDFDLICFDAKNGNLYAQFFDARYEKGLIIRCPYGQVGHRLWVKETYHAGKCGDAFKPSELSEKFYRVSNGGLWYPTTNTEPLTPVTPMGKTRPSIFMCRWMSRTTLEITGVRIEHLNNISEEDAVNEGVEVTARGDGSYPTYKDYLNPERAYPCNATRSFETLWKSVLGKDSWAKNPYVWVVHYKIINICESCKETSVLEPGAWCDECQGVN